MLPGYAEKQKGRTPAFPEFLIVELDSRTPLNNFLAKLPAQGRHHFLTPL